MVKNKKILYLPIILTLSIGFIFPISAHAKTYKKDDQIVIKNPAYTKEFQERERKIKRKAQEIKEKNTTYKLKTYARHFTDLIPDTATSIIFTDETKPNNEDVIDVDDNGDGGVVAWLEDSGKVMKVSTQKKGQKIEMGAMDELGFYYVLKSLKNGMAEFSDLKGYMFSVPFEDGVNMMIREALQEIHELADKAEMLGIEDIRSSAAVNEARRDIRARIATLNESKKVANTDMMTVLKDMSLNEEGYRVGCRLNGIVYEFVSYRPDAGDNPYVLENVSNRNPISRYRFVSFEMLSTAIRNYASSEKEDGGTAEYFRLMALAKKMVPVVENIETVVPKKADAAVLLIKAETPVTTEESGQLRFC